eukprot:Skav230552  [mRNA]  locus=scaffold2019:141:3280:- [translate_table: standard]
MPSNFKMSHCRPDDPLTPRGSSTRVQLLPTEIEMLSFGQYSSDRALYFLWSGDQDEIVRDPDFYLQPESFYRLTFSGDEGTDVFWLNLVGDIQQEDDSSLKHALDLAAGRRLDKIIQNTMKDAFTFKTLEWIGCTCEDDPNANEILQFHALLLLNHLGAVLETATYHQSYPWKAILFLWPSAQWQLCEEMRSMWEFVTACIDAVDSKSQTSKNLSWTRSQAFRECFIAAESINFDAERARNDPYFQAVIKAIAGITDDMHGPLLSSVPVELTFNDLRDCSKRFSKPEMTSAPNLHSIISRSCAKRNPSVQTLLPEASDWAEPLQGKTVKRNVFDSSRATDQSLGVSTSGLTRKKSEFQLTKPHIFSYRLHLLEILYKQWLTCENKDEFMPDVVFKKLWISCLLQPGVLFCLELPEYQNRVFIVCKAGPYSVKCLELVALPEPPNCFTVLGDFVACHLDITLVDMERIKVAVSSPCVLPHLHMMGWRAEGEWMSVPMFVAHVSILKITAKLLSSLCTLLKIKGHNRLDHKRRVELFLRYHECSHEYITEIMNALPEKPPRKKPSKDEAKDSDDDGEEHQE